jgi:hypothetical protein
MQFSDRRERIASFRNTDHASGDIQYFRSMTGKHRLAYEIVAHEAEVDAVPMATSKTATKAAAAHEVPMNRFILKRSAL